MKIPIIKDANWTTVVVTEIAAWRPDGEDIEVTLKSGEKIKLIETLDGETESNLVGQLETYFD